jgi:hypothetical protein
MRKARGIVSQRLRLHFQNLYAELDKDTADFFQRVMQQAERDHLPPPPVAHVARARQPSA